MVLPTFELAVSFVGIKEEAPLLKKNLGARGIPGLLLYREVTQKTSIIHIGKSSMSL